MSTITPLMDLSIQCKIANMLGSDYSFDKVIDTYTELLNLNDAKDFLQSEISLEEAISAII